MKAKYILIIHLILGLSTTVIAQSKNNHSLSISWQPLKNNYDGKEQALSILTIENTGNEVFPWNGWKLYFNFIRLAEPVDNLQPMRVNHVNGDYFYFQPNEKGKSLKPGEKIVYTMVSKSWIVNYNDAPQGFYLDWGNNKLEPLGAVSIIPPDDKEAFYRVGGDKEMNAEMIFEKNLRYQTTDALPSEKIIPSPVSSKYSKGSYSLKNKITIYCDPKFGNEGELMREDLKALFNISATLSSERKNKKSEIELVYDNSLASEAYKLSIGTKGITLYAGTESGIFYAIQSLKLLVEPEQYDLRNQTSIRLPIVQIEDEPRFGSRSLMLDVARNFQSKEQICKILDIMAFYKINTLHFHLNDDEGWRLAMPSLPELTAVGSRRAHWNGNGTNEWLPPSYGSGPFLDNPRATGFYSEADFVAILQYAKRRHIQVIPEIETPGHARAAIQAMNSRYQKFMALGDSAAAHKYLLQVKGDQSQYRSVQKWNDNVMDVALPSVYTFLEQVTDDLIALYKQAGAPLETIHFGGDEVPNGVWEQSPAFAKLKSEDPTINETADLWIRHFDKLYELLKSRGLYLTGWEEVGMEKVVESGKKKWIPYKGFQDRNIHLNVWNNLGGNEDLAYRLANAGYKIKLSFVSNFYMDMAYYKRFQEQGFYWGGFIDLERPFSFVPFNYLSNQKQDWLGRTLPDRILSGAERLTEKGKSNIVGLQALLWSETIKSEKEMERMLFPRLFAFSERAWAQPGVWEQENGNYDTAYLSAIKGFFQTIGERELRRLPRINGGYFYRIPSPGAKQIAGKVHVNMELPGFTVRYNEDGIEPTANSKVYSAPVDYKKGLIFKAFNRQGDSSLPIAID